MSPGRQPPCREESRTQSVSSTRNILFNWKLLLKFNNGEWEEIESIRLDSGNLFLIISALKRILEYFQHLTKHISCTYSLVCNVKISIYFQLQLCTMIQSTCLATYMSISVHHCVWCSYSYIICCIFTKYQICVMWLSAQKYIISNSKVKCRWPPDNLPDHTPTKLRIFCSAFDE